MLFLSLMVLLSVSFDLHESPFDFRFETLATCLPHSSWHSADPFQTFAGLLEKTGIFPRIPRILRFHKPLCRIGFGDSCEVKITVFSGFTKIVFSSFSPLLTYHPFRFQRLCVPTFPEPDRCKNKKNKLHLTD